MDAEGVCLRGRVARSARERAGVPWTLVHADGTAAEGVDQAEVQTRLASCEHFWLDVGHPSSEELELLADMLALHTLVRDDIGNFGQQPKADDYAEHTLIVLYGATHDEDSLVEVHSVVAADWLLTVHTESCPAFIGLRKRTMLGGPLPSTAALMHRIADSLADSFYPELEKLDDRVDELERLVLGTGEHDVLPEVLALRRRLVVMRRVLGPQRDVVARLAAGTIELPGADDEVRLGFRAAQDELFRVTEVVEAQRDLLTGALEVHLSTTSNRLNEVMRRLAAVSTIFLPITFLSGFFGQNFGFMVRHIDGSPSFVLGALLQLVVAVGVVAFLHLRRWI
jgi:magnesium transporter